MERDIPVAVIPATDANGEHVNNAPTVSYTHLTLPTILLV